MEVVLSCLRLPAPNWQRKEPKLRKPENESIGSCLSPKLVNRHFALPLVYGVSGAAEDRRQSKRHCIESQLRGSAGSVAVDENSASRFELELGQFGWPFRVVALVIGPEQRFSGSRPAFRGDLANELLFLDRFLSALLTPQ